MTTNRHILSVLVENKSGVLARISGLISRRGFNIHSLAVGETEDPHVSRMTVTVDADDVVPGVHGTRRGDGGVDSPGHGGQDLHGRTPLSTTDGRAGGRAVQSRRPAPAASAARR